MVLEPLNSYMEKNDVFLPHIMNNNELTMNYRAINTCKRLKKIEFEKTGMNF